MKAVLLSMTLGLFLSSNAIAMNSCESTVVPLAVAMAKATNRPQLSQKRYIGVSVDHSQIRVTLASKDGDEEGTFLMTLAEVSAFRYSCHVVRAEAL